MADYGINIEVNPSGAVSGSRTAKRSIKEIDSAAKTTTKTLSALATASAAVFAATVAGATVAVQANRKFEKSLSDLSAITGATGDQLEYLKKQALDIGATTQLSATQAAEAFKLIASAKPDLLESSEALNEVARSAVTLAEAAGVTLPQAANTLGSALNQFGAEADEANRYINVLAAGSKLGAAEVYEVAEALKVSGVSAASASVSFEETNAAIQTLSTIAIKGSEAGTALRNIILKLETDTDTRLRPSVVGLSGALSELASRNESTAALTKRFGLENVNAADALIKNASAVGDLTTKLTGTNTAFEQAATRTNNLDGDLKQLSSSTESLALAIGEKLNPVLRYYSQAASQLAADTAIWLRGDENIIFAQKDLADAYQNTIRIQRILNETTERLSSAKAETSKWDVLGIVQSIKIGKATADEERLRGKLAMALEEERKARVKLQGLKDTGVSELPSYIANLGKPLAAPTPVAATPEATESVEGQKVIQNLQETIALTNALGVEKAQLQATQGLSADVTAAERAEVEKLAASLYNISEAQKATAEAADARRQADELAASKAESNIATLAALDEKLRQTGMSARELAQRQAELSLNEYASQEQIDRAREMSAVMFDMNEQERLRTEVIALQKDALSERSSVVDDYYEKLGTLREALDAQAITEQEYYETSANLNAEYNDRIAAQEAASNAARLEAGGQLFGGLAGLAKTFAGEQSGIYKAMFAASQAFAIAESVIKIQQGIASAAALPFPANIPAIASVVAATAGIVTTIQNTALNLADGGKVYGPGTGTSDSIPANLSSGEFVMPAAATRRNYGVLEAMRGGATVTGGAMNVTVINQNGSQIKTRQLSPNDVQIIVSDMLDEQLSGRMANELSDPYSSSRSVLSSDTTLSRRAAG